MPTLRILVIAGSDSGGGAGIQADIKTITMLGGFAMTAITAITAQNTLGVQAVEAVSEGMIAAQIDAVIHDIGVDAVKIGMLGDAQIVRVVAERLQHYALNVPIILDPVMQAKGGASLLADDAADVLRESLMPLVTVITPNIPEAERLSGITITGDASALEAAKVIAADHDIAVLVKGGHGTGDELRDLLYHHAASHIFPMQRIESKHTHGTGCTMASAIATLLAQGVALDEAVVKAQAYLRGAITHAPEFGSGHGPMWHGWAL